MQANDLVIIDPSILEDQSTKSNHHIFKRIIEEKEIGTVASMDVEKSEEENANLYWVQFYMAAIRIDEKYLVRSEN
jgi:hypothetical protein